MADAQEKAPALAALVRQGDAQKEADGIAPGIYGVRDISNAYLVTTGDGDVMINTGFMDNAARNRDLLAPHRAGPLRAVVLTQSHADHFGGIDTFREGETEILAGPGFARNWQDMKRLQPFFAPRSRKLWGATLKRGTRPAPPPEVTPQEIADGHTFTLGERRFELLHTPEGETTDALSVWLPEERIAFTGNLFGPVWLSMPNFNTLRGDRPRSVRTFLASLERVRALGADILVTGHGDPIFGAQRIRADLDRVEAAVSHVLHATLEGMNAGKSLHELMRTVEVPEDIAIAQMHGKTSWTVKAIWHEHAGWFRYESTTELYGVPQTSIHADLVELAGADALASRAQDHAAKGEPLEAIHLCDIVLHVYPDNTEALGAKHAALGLLLTASGNANLSETMWLKSEMAACEEKLAGA
ncbi:MBL fold metallo-hydrolase [Novosphingobium profundi]|uniref:MBL fold metallo-hydrolase n=1 Tax=Novosphingobium profundi TaxID=1774954 RepID=UPI001CFC56A1|nr:MBL fold metallo-hydrolase [Novosphingobium profundi]